MESEMNAFWDGFEKQALQDTRRQENLAVGVTSILPLGTTLHTALKDPGGGDRGKEWVARMGGAIGGSMLGALAGDYLTGGRGAVFGANVGKVTGEILASNLVHKGKYDARGNLKEQYRRKGPKESSKQKKRA